MTDIVFKPERGSGVLNGRGLYRAYVNRKPIDLLVRARTAGDADLLLQYLFRTQTAGKTLVADAELMKDAAGGDDSSSEKENR